MRDGLPGDVLLVVDSAYAEYVTRNDYAAGIDLVEEFDNVVMTRTFSKIFGLAALRLGLAYCPPAVADVLNRIRGPFNVTAAAQAAGIAALGDIGHADEGRAHNDIWLPWLTKALSELGLTVHPSVGNFILVRFESPQAADNGYAALMAAGCIARQVAGYGLPECIRITVGLEDENRIVVEALRSHLEGSMSATVLFDRVAWIGLGLIGSSLGHALKRDGLAGHIAGTARSAATREKALEIGFIDSAHETPAEAVADADLVVICAPVGANAAIAKAMAPGLKKGAIVTDVGSVKMAVIRDVGPCLPKAYIWCRATLSPDRKLRAGIGFSGTL